MALLPALLFAQISLNGTITDSQSGKPLAGATLSLNGTNSIQSNSDGTFIFKNTRKGRSALKASYVGYTTKNIEVIAGQLTGIHLSLDPAPLVTEEVILTATRAAENSATTFHNISKEELEKNNLGKDLPFLLDQTPSVIVTSDAGAGIGYTGIRIRGSDPTRINVTINGIPYNDTESQGTYFVDVPDFASSVDNIQLQRGVGTSTNGAGAFGGSINIQTATRRDSAYAELANSLGSYRTWKNTVSVGTGLLNHHFTIDGRLSRIQSDGYIDRASSRLKSYFLAGAFYSKHDIVHANVFSGTERTYQAWNGVPQPYLVTDRTYNSFTYPDQTDNYTQDHSQLLWSHSFNPQLSFSTALHYTHGKGYYEEYEDAATLADYGIADVVAGPVTFKQSNLVRRRWLDNDFYGTTWSLNYTPKSRLSLTFGGAYNEYDGKHYGEVIWAQYASTSYNHFHYYDETGFKTDFNSFGKAGVQFGKTLFSADLQYRHTSYELGGTDRTKLVPAQTARLDFFNPKLGITYQPDDRNNVYASFAVANKEPDRDDYVNSTPVNRPVPEHLNDLEAGYRMKGQHFQGGINGFGMFYKNQLILTGKINDVGEYIRQNIPQSYRVGAEFDGKVQVSPVLSWAATAALSRNRVKNFTSFDDDYDNGGQLATSFKRSDLAFSPSFIASSEITFSPGGKLETALLTKYAGRQFLDNTSNASRAIDAFFVNNLRLSYTFNMKAVKSVGVSLLANNIFNRKYETNGYTFSYRYGGQYTTENYYFPQATANFLLGLNVKI